MANAAKMASFGRRLKKTNAVGLQKSIIVNLDIDGKNFELPAG